MPAYKNLQETAQVLGVSPIERRHRSVMTVQEADALCLGDGVSTKTLILKLPDSYCAVTVLSFQKLSWPKLHSRFGARFSLATDEDIACLGTEPGGIPPCGFLPEGAQKITYLAIESVFMQPLIWINPGRRDLSWQLTGASLKSLFSRMYGITCSDEEILKQ